MTALAAWCAWDERKLSAVYVASDSLITWSDGQRSLEPKTFAHDSEPQMVGYCGDRDWGIDLCKHLLNSITVRSGMSSFAEKAANHLEQKLRSVARPVLHRSAILHAARFTEANFLVTRYDIDRSKSLTTEVYELPLSSDKIDFIGSGRERLFTFWHKWSSSSDAGTSRSIFGAFCDFLLSEADPSCAPPPQVIELFENGPPKQHGIWFAQRRFLGSREVPYHKDHDSIEWRDLTFQRVSAKDGTLLPNAQRQPVPVFNAQYLGFGKIQNTGCPTRLGRLDGSGNESLI